MANVPGVLLLGGSQLYGGPIGFDPSSSNVGVSLLQYFSDWKVMQITPAVAATGASAAASLSWWPWYDEAAADSANVIASATSTTITVSPSPSWTTNAYAGALLRIVNPTTVGFSHQVRIVSNTGDTLTVAGWGAAGTPVAGRAFWIGIGRWRDYHPVPGYLHLTELGVTVAQRGGSGALRSGVGVGPDAGLIHDLQAVWPSSPYFQLAKYDVGTAAVVGDIVGGGSFATNFEAWLARVDAAWTARATGNTLAWELVVIDTADNDALDWYSTPANQSQYLVSLQILIAYLRVKLDNPSLRVLLPLHDVNLLNRDSVVTGFGNPGAIAAANRIHRTAAYADANVGLFDLNGVRLYGEFPLNYRPTRNVNAYAAYEYWTSYSAAVVRGYQRLIANDPPAIDNGFPVYFLIGDSIAVGLIVENFATLLDSPTLTDSPRPAGQLVYNGSTNDLEVYDLADNSNVNGTPNPTGGPEFSLTDELAERHPDGFLLIKRGVSGSGLASYAVAYSGGIAGGRWSKAYVGTENYAGLLADANAAFALLNADGKQADVRGVFVVLGTNDAGTVAGEGAGALFAEELPTFVADLRADLTTRTSGADLPVVWVKPQLAAAGLLADEARDIRAALVARAEADEQFVVVDVDDLERVVADDLHLTPEALVEVGRRLAAAIDEIALA